MNLHFLSGLPRSGSTLLAAILNQNPSVHVSTTSSLVQVLDVITTTWHNNPLLIANDQQRQKLMTVMYGVCRTFYAEHPEKVIIDKNRTWPVGAIMDAMRQILDRPIKIIATVRPVQECAASFVRIANPSNLDEFMRSGGLMTHLRQSYQCLFNGYQTSPESFLFIEYDDLAANPKKQLARIHDFLELPYFNYEFDCVDGECVKEDDEALHGYAGLHDIKPKVQPLQRPSPQEVLGRHYLKFTQKEFWNPDKPMPFAVDLLGDALSCAIAGDVVNSEKFVDMALQINPDDQRALFNKGWHELVNGNLKKGIGLLSCGRDENLFGNPPPSNMPMFQEGDDIGGKTILLNLEGGLGDQIANARFASNFSELGAKVILAGSPELASILMKIDGVTAFVAKQSAGDVFHDLWCPAMSAPFLLGLEYATLSGKPYIPSEKKERQEKMRVGIRWAGNPMFEHEQHRKFDPKPMFELKNVDLISLQRDDETKVPDFIETPDLSTWQATKLAIESLDLIITSCTSIAHLSAAMGKPTWIIIPVMPYYLWALPGEKTPWYDSAILFRQTKYGEWADVFEKIQAQLVVVA